MRVSVQGCLILLLCFFAPLVYAESRTAEWRSSSGWNCSTLSGDQICIDGSVVGSINGEPKTYYWRASCLSPKQPVVVGSDQIYEGVPNYSLEIPTFECKQCGEQLTHEPGGTIDPNTCGTCSTGYIHAESQGHSAPFQCMLNREPGECSAIGKAEAQTSEGAFCVEECEHGMFNGVCLPPPEPEKECTKDSPDYRGVLVQGYGKPVITACGDFDQCADGKPGKVGLVNGELRCIADDYGQGNECAPDEIFIVDQYGVICAGLVDTPEEEPTPEDPNTDTDGDGQPDEYNPDNDPNIYRKQLDDLNEGQDQANKSLGNLEKIGKGTNDRLDDIGNELKNNSDGIGELVGFTKQINDKLDAPDGGLSTDSLGNAPEFGESATRLKNALFGHPTIQAVTTIPTIGTSTTCPTWKIPANDYWDALTLDVHCAILEDYRSTLSVLFLFFWTVVAIFLFLRA